MNKFTVIKVLSNKEKILKQDVEKYKKLFLDKEKSLQESIEKEEVFLEHIPKIEKSITLVRVGNDNYQPTPEEIETFREAFKEAMESDNGFVVVPKYVEVDVIDVDSVLEIE